MDLEQTQVIDFCQDFDDETDEEIDESNKKPVAHLKVLCQKGFPEKLFPVYEGDNVIGRQEDVCSICVPLKAFSREHACIEVRGETHCIFDKGSRNKTRRGKLVLRPDVRYELKGNDKLTFGDVDAVYLFQKDDGSDTASESDFQTAPIATMDVDSTGPSPKSTDERNGQVTNATSVVYEEDEDSDSDESVDLLQPTQAYPMFGQKKEQTLNLPGSSDDEDDSRRAQHNVTVKDTPAASRHTGMSTLVLPESETEDEEDDRNIAASTSGLQTVPVEVVEDTQQDEVEDKSVLYAATQAYGMVAESDDGDETTDEEEDKKALLAAATQAFTDIADNENDDTDQTGRARTFVADSDEEEKDTTNRIAPVVAEETDEEEDNDDIDVNNILAAPTLACDMEDIPDDEDHETQAFPVKNEKPSSPEPECGIDDATQAFTDDKTATLVNDFAQKSKDKEKTKKFLNQGAKHEVLEEDQATQMVDDVSDGATMAITDGETMAVDEVEVEDVATQVISTDDATVAVDVVGGNDDTRDDATVDVCEEATQVITDDATLAVSDEISEEPEKRMKRKSKPVDEVEEEATQVITEEEATQVITEDATVAVSEIDVESPQSPRGRGRRGKSKRDMLKQEEDESVVARGEGRRRKVKADLPAAGEEETQVIVEDSTVSVNETEHSPPPRSRGRRGKGKTPMPPVGKEATQMITEDITATIAVSETEQSPQARGRGRRGKGKAGLPIEDEEPTQVITEDATVAVSEIEHSPQPRGRGRRGKGKTDLPIEDEEPTQVITEDATVAVSEIEHSPQPRGRGRRGKGKTDLPIEDEEPTQVITEDATVAVSEIEHSPQPRGRGRRGKGKADLPIEDEEPTQVITEDATVAVSEIEHSPQPRGRGRRGKGKPDLPTGDEEPTQVITEDATLDADESKEEISPSKLTKATRTGKKKSKVESQSEDKGNTPVINEDVTVENQSPKVTPVHKAKKKTFDLSLEDNNEPTQVFEEDNGVEPTVQYDMDVDDPDQRPSKGGKAKKTKAKNSKTPEPVVELEATQTYGMDIEEEDLGEFPEGKSGEALEENLEATQAYGLEDSNKSPARDKTNKRGVAVTEVEGTGNRRLSRQLKKELEDQAAVQAFGMDEETPPLSEEMMRDSEDSAPHVPVIPLPATSPHKSALTSPEKRKKSPSPKRVKFTAAESETSEELQTDSTKETKSGKQTQRRVSLQEGKSQQEAEKQPSKLTRSLGRKSVPDIKKSQETTNQISKNKKGTKSRTSLPVEVTEKPAEEVEKTGQGSSKKTDKKEECKNEEVLPCSESENKKGGSKRVGRRSNQPGTAQTQDCSEDTSSSARRRGRRSEMAKVEKETEPLASSVAPGKISEKVGRRSKQIKDSIDEVNVVQQTDTRKGRQSKGKKNEVITNEAAPGTSDRDQQPTDSVEPASDKSAKRVRGQVNKRVSEPLQVEEAAVKRRGGRGKKMDDSVNDTSKISIEDDHSETSIANASVLSEPRRGKSRASKSKESEQKDKEKCETDQISKRTHRQTVDKDGGKRESVSKETEETDSVESETSISSRTSRKGGNSKVIETKNTTAIRGKKRQSRVNSPDTSKLEESIDTGDNGIEQPVEEKLNVSECTNKSRGSKRGNGGSQKTVVQAKSAEQDSQLDSSRGSMAKGKRGRKDSQPDSSRGSMAKRKRGNNDVEETVEATPAKRSRKADPETPCHSSIASVINSPSLRRKSTEPNKAKVMFTGVIDQQGQKIVKDLGGELVDSVYDCTHLVTDKARRTVKFLCCLSRGIPIVQTSWLESCKQSGMFLDGTPFLVQDSGTEKQYRFCLQRSLDKAGQESLLAGYQVHVTKSVRPEPAQMKDILQCAGAKFLPTMPKKFTENTLVISCEDDRKLCEAAVQADGKIVNTEFLLTGILRQEVSVESYRIFTNTKKRAADSSDDNTSKRRRR